MSNFSHLHVHSHYSLLDGLPKIPDLVTNAKDKGFTSLALTDHGVMYGLMEFYKEATAAGLKPILGMETYMAPRKLIDKQTKIDDLN
ncbi:MAG: PHP domain-containing protein, partial [Patescibacteria group bacterium]